MGPGSSLLDTVDGYGTICVGTTWSGTISQAAFGSLPETVGEEVDKTVVISHGVGDVGS